MGAKPGMRTSIPKDHQAFLRFSLSAFVVFLGTTLPFGNHTGFSPPFSDSFSTHNDSLPLDQLLGKMDIIELGIALARKPQDFLTDLFSDPIGRGSACIAVNQSPDSFLFKGFPNALGLTVGHTHFFARLLQGDLAYQNQLQYLKPLQLPLTHGNLFVLHKEDILPL
jgi:hypothetical protein